MDANMRPLRDEHEKQRVAEVDPQIEQTVEIPQIKQVETARISEGFSGYNMHELHYTSDAMYGRAGSGSRVSGFRGGRAGNGERAVYATARRGRPPQQVEQGRIQNEELMGVKDGWVVFALHPTKGRRVIKEGIVLVDDERIVCRGTQKGFFSAQIPDPSKDQIQIKATMSPEPGQITFPNLFILAPTLRQMARDVAEVSHTGAGEVTHPLEVPREEHVTPGVDSRIAGQIYRSAKASAMRGEDPQLPVLPADDTLPPEADARDVERVYKAVISRAVRDVALESGGQKQTK